MIILKFSLNHNIFILIIEDDKTIFQQVLAVGGGTTKKVVQYRGVKGMKMQMKLGTEWNSEKHKLIDLNSLNF